MARKTTRRTFNSNPGYHKLLCNWRELVDKQTPTELVFEHELAKRGVRYRFQHLVWHYIIDFALPDLKVAIELDGDSHSGKDAREADEKRDAWLTKQGWRIYRFRNEDAQANPSACLAVVKELF